MTAVFWLLDTLLSLYFWLIICHVILSWLSAFNVVNLRQPVVGQIALFLWRITEPVLGPVRSVLGRLFGNLGGIDISPILVLVLIGFLRRLLADAAVSIR